VDYVHRTTLGGLLHFRKLAVVQLHFENIPVLDASQKVCFPVSIQLPTLWVNRHANRSADATHPLVNDSVSSQQDHPQKNSKRNGVEKSILPVKVKNDFAQIL